MTALTQDEEKLAKAAIEENEKLRRLLNEANNESRANDDYNGTDTERADSIFSLKRRNDILRGEIADLQNQLVASDVSAAETVHKYNRLQAKRAHLRNEVQGLRNIKMHQTPKVREANRFAGERMQMKKSSDEANRATKNEIKTLKEMREKEIEQLHVTMRKEAYLKERVDCTVLPTHLRDKHALKAAIDAKERTIKKLEYDIEIAQNRQGNRSNYGGHNEEKDIGKLREEYVKLQETLTTLQYELN
ncbi:uncharacterized protein TM35_000024790 [Trypanosoma theileri]|uniref:Uncharacterized protein n=1 Tax=Trypanosoma theileri TaxID=67003 RepID=A0A1X0P948_9TRYP|nr:uncharacterized protein TM35_000024790 [Trypanosoma theileri]ORC93153.1 hypothetical protein TM35_000024790 [Trypanosoma theileri]